MLRIYGRAFSVNVQRVLWAVDELSLSYERLDLGGRFGGLDDADYLAINPHRRVPTIVDGHVVVWAPRASEKAIWNGVGQIHVGTDNR